MKKLLIAALALSSMGCTMMHAGEMFEQLINTKFIKEIVDTAEKAGKDVRSLMADAAKVVAEKRKKVEEQLASAKKNLDEELKELSKSGNQTSVAYAHYKEEIARLHAELDALNREEAETLKTWNPIGAKVADVSIDILKETVRTGLEGVRVEMNQKKEIQVEAVRSEAQKDTAIANKKIQTEADLKKHAEFLRVVTDPKNIKIWGLGAVGVIAGYYASKHGFALLSDYLRHLYKNPQLALETSLLPFSEQLKRRLLGSPKVEDKVTDVVLAPELRQQVDVLAQSIAKAVENDSYFRNGLFYGPPGTGKTMIATKMARSCGLHYILTSASMILQFETEEALIKLTELMTFAKNSSEKVMIIIDEAEQILAQRHPAMDKKVKAILNHLLTFFGTESKDIIIIALTNRPQDLDAAVLSRLGAQIEIKAPALPERIKILNKYINELIVAPKKQEMNHTFLGKIINAVRPKKDTAKPILIDEGLFSPEALELIGVSIDGFVGRDIFDLVNSMRSYAMSSDNHKLTQAMVTASINEALNKKKNQNDGFKGYENKREGA